jgi:hypothetical protein
VDVYFSHSYRDVEINQYFFGQLSDQGFQLFADQKSPIWCVAKLERYIHNLSAFLSIVPRRSSKDPNAITYSPYIGYELRLARRSGLPRLIFVDDELLKVYRDQFPKDVVPFVRIAPDADRFQHVQAIRKFKKALADQGPIPKRDYRHREVTIVAQRRSDFDIAAKEIAEILESKAYLPKIIDAKQIAVALDDVELLEAIRTSEFCVFLLSAEMTDAYVALAVAHAYCVPSIRLQHDATALEVDATVAGRIRWATKEHLLSAFESQLGSLRTSFVQAVDTSSVRKISVTQRTPRTEQLWDVGDAAGLVKHVYPSDQYVREIVNRVRGLKDGNLVNTSDLEVCELIYRTTRSHYFSYEHEPPTLVKGKQAIRTPAEIWNDNAATCLDLACLFASLLKCAGRVPIILIFGVGSSLHSVVGFKRASGAQWRASPSLGAIRGALKLEEIVLFEATGAVVFDGTVAVETLEERRGGNGSLEFTIARQVAERLVSSSDVSLKTAVLA